MSLFEQQAREFVPRHIGPDPIASQEMLKSIGTDL